MLKQSYKTHLDMNPVIRVNSNIHFHGIVTGGGMSICKNYLILNNLCFYANLYFLPLKIFEKHVICF